jgi:hypothetical protein
LDQKMVLGLLGNVLIHWAAIVGALSVIVHARVPWWTSPVGRHLMVYMAAIDVVLVLSCIRIDVGQDTWWFSLLRLAVFVFVPIVMTQRLWIQFKAQRVVRDEKRDRERKKW